MAVARRALEASDPNKIGVVGLASLIFFAVAGSPAGTEDTIVAAGPLLALLGFVIMPVVWAVPESLVTAELATAFPHNGGYVVWVTRAFGPTTGFVVGILKYFANILDKYAPRRISSWPNTFQCCSVHSLFLANLTHFQLCVPGDDVELLSTVGWDCA